MSDSGAIDDELLRMAGNPKVAEAIKESLRQLSRGAAGADLAEMANELLAGRTSLREVGQSAAYAPQLAKGFAAFQDWQAALSIEDQQALEQQAHDKFDIEDG